MRGITLLEMLVAMGILIIAATMIESVFSNFSDSGKLIEAHSGLIGVLRDARSRTLASESSSNYGVHFQSDRAILFRGNTYNAADPANEAYVLSGRSEIGAIALSGGASDLIFTRLHGTTTASGTITIRSTNNPSKTRIITILPSGGVQ
ncbi:hypothetical protein A2W54_03380 [Candidatus Giovannonibacteria bacterium RIFCSPHIGHO2_02_43_13]|uniref:General secretion pathway GspH domain-containing protein n=1 Tax=Candidatus Giovannonibacteria bacterium RIFCSPHIGHO2_02_43_13 TaxID=1798330 RepID=A0A1F5WQC4_9BACT|nr:MAG: hypothetical protein UW28_C0004G0021 [Parcubacteria group bacterium GW2011_GWA2_44_13]OGF73929.1 MAG: hypothetical protein A3E06_00590 [Candidatus Giovannonibacteria bacterium RIFCSPHIGHO2_12_FULL_44_42]OGF77820.1 MAG: hypothetical protein A2W54_03380 [Candidatus Giovannonibacteria bacterium RIFCSPHIGHO2_02_43_13]OGF88845.1 MAG: hypothetical protein A3I94_02475 [Candidatus Giovannonibacteria bacterium RIFCSPLOWO2_02_FULL_43_54]OGF96809.1 MAG: hypothetical protein A3H08_01365 [Candidatus